MFNFVIPFIILIVVVVFIHEYGHYYFAKKYGVGVTDFSIGFGNELILPAGPLRESINSGLKKSDVLKVLALHLAKLNLNCMWCIYCA